MTTIYVVDATLNGRITGPDFTGNVAGAKFTGSVTYVDTPQVHTILELGFYGSKHHMATDHLRS